MAATEGDEDLERVVGQQVGNYVIDRPLARGGMGAVFVAKHPALEREVAVKFLSRDFERDPVLHARFMQEARLTASLQHPNVVDIYDFGELDGHFYYVMEFLRGRDLAAELREVQRFGYEQAVTYLEQVCAGLEAAHRAGIVHRDLKPANIFVVGSDPPLVKLMDFGVAKVTSSGPGATRAGQILGTPSHMAPEQALGDIERITAQSDLYSVGVIAYEMLTGGPLFQHESDIMLMTMHIRDPIVPVRVRAPDVPERLAEIVEWCLEKDPARRPKSARALAARFVAARHIARGIARREAEATDGPDHPGELALAVKQTPVNFDPVTPVTPERRPASVVRNRLPGQDVVVYTERYSRPDHGTVSTGPEVHGRGTADDAGASPPADGATSVEEASAAPDATRRPPAGDAPVVLGTSPGVDPPEERDDASPPPTLLSEDLDEASPSDAAAPEPSSVVLSEADTNVLNKLLRKMQRSGDFPAFVRNVGEISVKADADREFSAGQLGDSILKDYALTAKLIRTVNTMFANRFGGKVFSVSHAVVILGFDRVRSLALGISVFKDGGKPGKKKSKEQRQRAALVTDAAINSLVSGEVARTLARSVDVDDPEVAMMCAMFRNLGHHLVLQYLPDQYAEIVELANQRKMPLEAAAARVLGTSFRKLGVGVAEQWKLPQLMVDAMGTNVPRGMELHREEDRIAALSQFANDLTEIVASAPADRWKKDAGKLLQRHDKLLDLEEDQLEGLLGRVKDSFEERYAALFGPEGKKKSRVMAKLGGQNADADPGVVVMNAEASGARATRSGGGGGLASLARTTTELTADLDRGKAAQDILAKALETLQSVLTVRRLLLLAPTEGHDQLKVSHGVGADAESLKAELVLPIASGDAFATALNGARDVVIHDAYSDSAMKRLPQRYYEAVGTPALGIYACSARGEPVVLALIDANDAADLPAPKLVARTRALRQLIARAAARV